MRIETRKVYERGVPPAHYLGSGRRDEIWQLRTVHQTRKPYSERARKRSSKGVLAQHIGRQPNRRRH
jgi:hypothetical protein